MRPSTLAIGLLGLWLVVAVIAVTFPSIQAVWMLLGATVALMLLIDGVWVWREYPPDVTRNVPHALSVGVSTPVGLRIENKSQRTLRCRVHDHRPADFRTEGLPTNLTLPPKARVELSYLARPVERGDHTFGAAELLVQSPFRFWWRKHRSGGGTTVQVHPNFGAVAKYALFAAENKLARTGVRLVRRRGVGTEFHELREYRPGDSMRVVNWKATAKRAKLVSREHREEQDQQIVFLLDCGRRMRARDGELSHFDQALNALLLLSYVALRQGDRVGLHTYGGPERVMSPRGGLNRLPEILQELYTLQPTLEASNAPAALLGVLSALKKRSLIILLTNLGDEVDEPLLHTLRVARKRNLVLLASLRDRALREVIERPVATFDQALTHAATQHFLLQRQARQAERVAAGALSLDVEPQLLPTALVNRYLDLKSKSIL